MRGSRRERMSVSARVPPTIRSVMRDDRRTPRYMRDGARGSQARARYVAVRDACPIFRCLTATPLYALLIFPPGFDIIGVLMLLLMLFTFDQHWSYTPPCRFFLTAIADD